MAHIAETTKFYQNIEIAVLNTYEKSKELMKETEAKMPKSFYFEGKNNKSVYFTDQNQNINEENQTEFPETRRKFSYSNNCWENKEPSLLNSSRIFKDSLLFSDQNTPNHKDSLRISSRNQPIIQEKSHTSDHLKNVYHEKDFNHFLNLKLNGFKEYNMKKSPYLQEKKSKVEVFSYLFDQNLIKTNSKKVMQLRLKKIADGIRKKDIKTKFQEEIALNTEENESLNKKKNEQKQQIEDFFKKEEKFLDLIRKKINRAFNEEVKSCNGNRTKSIGTSYTK